MKNRQSTPSHEILIESHAHKADFQTKMHQHKRHSLLYVVSGQGQCRTKNKSYSLAANTAIILQAQQSHQLIDTPNKAMTIFVVYFSKKENKTMSKLFTSNKEISVPTFTVPKIRRLLRQMLHEQENKPPLYQESIQQCLNIIILELYRIQINSTKNKHPATKPNSEKQTAAVLEYIEKNIYEHHTLASAAKMAEISQRQFTTLCRKLTGNSFNQHINKLRIKRAITLLRNTQTSVAAIAFEVGYEDLSTFYRAFKRINHKSPLEFKDSQN